MTIKDPQFYENALNNNPSRTELETFAKEVEEILAGKKKGLEILKKTGRNPDPQVLDNQKKLNSLLEKIKKLL